MLVLDTRIATAALFIWDPGLYINIHGFSESCKISTSITSTDVHIDLARKLLYRESIIKIIRDETGMDAREYVELVESYLNSATQGTNIWVDILYGVQSKYSDKNGFLTFMLFDPVARKYPFFQDYEKLNMHQIPTLERLWMIRK